MINTFITRCARNAHVYRRVWNQNLNLNLNIVKCVRLLNHQPKNYYQTLNLGRVLSYDCKQCNKLLSNNFIDKKIESLDPFSTLTEVKNVKKRQARIYSDTFDSFKRCLEHRDDFTMTDPEWEKLLQDILEENPSAEKILDSTMMGILGNKPDLSLSFFGYLKSKKEPNLSTMSCFFHNCAVKHEDIVLEEFEKCKETFGSSTIFKKKVASAIVLTREWRQVKDWLVADKAFYSLSPSVLKMSLKDQDYITFNEVWTKTIAHMEQKVSKTIPTTFFEAWKDGWIPTDLLLELLKLEDLPLNENEMRKLNLYCESEWAYCRHAELVRVDFQCRRCNICGKNLPEVEPLDESIIKKMYTETVRKALISDNIFKQTHPEEVQKFLKFMRKQEPFDYVIDGRNLVPVTEKYDVQCALEELTNLRNRGKHILVISKGNIFKGVDYPGPVFIVGHRTYDDIYMLLAALMSGPKCYLVTNDDFSEHIAMMSPELRPHFYLWRSQQRVYHHHAKKFMHPATYKFRTSETEEGWHVPCKARRHTKSFKTYSNSYLDMTLRKFLCIKKAPEYVPSNELVLFRKVTEDWKKMMKGES